MYTHRDMDATGTGGVYFYEFSQPTSARNVETGKLLGAEGKAMHGGDTRILLKGRKALSRICRKLL